MGRFIDLTGQLFGRLTVLDRAYTKNKKPCWKCLCECGKHTIVEGSSLRLGRTRSCGCLNMEKVINLTGQIFGKLTVLSHAYTKNGHAYWNCSCECGEKTIVRGGHLRSGDTHSCGCRSGEKNPWWKGDKLKYSAAHMWMKQHKPKPPVCEMCRERPPTELSFNGENKHWTRNPEDYQYLCGNCHKLKDRGQVGVKPLTKARMHRIREFYRVGAANQRELADLFKVDQTTISNIIRRVGIYQDFF